MCDWSPAPWTDISAWIIFVLCRQSSWKSDIFYLENITHFYTFHESLSSVGYNTMHDSLTILCLIAREIIQSFEDPKSQGGWLTHQMLNPTPGSLPRPPQHAKWQLLNPQWQRHLSPHFAWQEIPSTGDGRDSYRHKLNWAYVWLSVQIYLLTKPAISKTKPATI